MSSNTFPLIPTDCLNDELKLAGLGRGLLQLFQRATEALNALSRTHFPSGRFAHSPVTPMRVGRESACAAGQSNDRPVVRIHRLRLPSEPCSGLCPSCRETTCKRSAQAHSGRVL